MSIYDYIERYVPGGHRSRLGALLDVAYNIEYGAETRVQSSLNMLYLIGFSKPNTFTIFGESDEKFHINGGNDQVPTILATKLAGQITANTPLRRDQGTRDKTFKLTFQNGAGTFDKVYDHVVACAAVLDSALGGRLLAGRLQRRQETAIKEQGMGTNSKIHLQFIVPFLARPGLQRRDLFGTRLPEHLGGHTRAGRATPGSSRGTRAVTSASRSAAARRSSRRRRS